MKSVNDILKIHAEAEKDLLKIQGVHTVGVGRKIKAGKKQDEVAIRVYVNKKRRKEDVPDNERIPETINGVITDVIERPPAVIIAHGQGGDSKLMGGMNVGPLEMTGTLGAIAIDNRSGEAVILSCAHVFTPSRQISSANTQINSPSTDPSRPVATLNRIVTDGIDAAIATINDPHGYKCEMIDSRIGPIKGSLTDDQIRSKIQPGSDPSVRKVGVTTGYTTGRIDDVTHTVRVQYEGNQEVTLTGQIQIEADSGLFSDRGDSGACVVDASGMIVGLLIGGAGGQSYATPIESVLKQLDITICPS